MHLGFYSFHITQGASWLKIKSYTTFSWIPHTLIGMSQCFGSLGKNSYRRWFLACFAPSVLPGLNTRKTSGFVQVRKHMNTEHRASRIDILVTEMSELCYKQTHFPNPTPYCFLLCWFEGFGWVFLFFFVWECRWMYMWSFAQGVFSESLIFFPVLVWCLKQPVASTLFSR